MFCYKQRKTLLIQVTLMSFVAIGICSVVARAWQIFRHRSLMTNHLIYPELTSDSLVIEEISRDVSSLVNRLFCTNVFINTVFQIICVMLMTDIHIWVIVHGYSSAAKQTISFTPIPLIHNIFSVRFQQVGDWFLKGHFFFRS